MALSRSTHRYDTQPGEEWENIIQRASQADLAVAPGWYSTIHKAYGHRPLYLWGEDDAGNRAVLPAFAICHWLLGRGVTSMPFLDAGGPCGSSGPLLSALVDRLTSEARALGAGHVELRCVTPLDLPVQPSLEKVTLILSLPHDPDRLWRKLDAKVRNQVRKAKRAGLSVEVGGVELLDEFYGVFSINMRDLGSPVHGKAFFREILESFGKAARLTLVRKGGAPIGGLVSLAFKDTVYVPWASCLRQHAPLCPNMLQYWETIRRANKDGFRRFDFGRSTRGSGTYRFKRQWGAEEVQLYWYTIPLNGRQMTRVSREGNTWALMSRLWRRLPVGTSQILGPRIRKYLSQ